MANKAEEIVEKQFKNLQKLPEEKFLELVSLHQRSLGKAVFYLIILFALMGLLVLIHNVFIAGNYYSSTTYDGILTIEITIGVIILLVTGFLQLIDVVKVRKFKKALKTGLLEASQICNATLKEIEQEFRLLTSKL